ncbi:unnamed protein product [Candidula unifasciata]|uniref:Uncharacterized protein n=1 Tax=Candidula unifasciata TaxID=100452 RepID=A0A8S3YQH3_9EUPU|nr:unnamed protein product [Candidula unifasciata]
MESICTVVVFTLCLTGRCVSQGLSSTPATTTTTPEMSTTNATTTTTTTVQNHTGVTIKASTFAPGVTSSSGVSVADTASTAPGTNVTSAPPLWTKCTSGVSMEDVGNDNIAKVLHGWCENYETIISCLSNDITARKPDNPLDFFINLTFSNHTLRAKSATVCSKFKEKKNKLSCADAANQTMAGSCAADFSAGMMHIFSLSRDKALPESVLREVACDVTLQTTFCLKDTLSECDEDVQMVLLGYYSLFTNDTCVAKERPAKLETVVSKCAREAAQTLSRDQSEPEPTSLLDFLILGLKTDCKTYSSRYDCYRRELTNITNFRDFWLSLTFDHTNAVSSQKAYCDQIEQHVIPRITSECFNKSQPGLAACEVGFGREVEAIREEWFKNPDFDGLQLQTLACRTSVTRAACLDNAMQPCGLQVSRAMAISEIGILPDICRRLLAVKTPVSPSIPADVRNITDSGEFNFSSPASFQNNKTRSPAVFPGRNEWLVSDQAEFERSPENVTTTNLTKMIVDKEAKPTEDTTSRSTNITETKKNFVRRKKLGNNATTSQRQSNSGGHVQTATVIVGIIVGIIVSCNSCV